MTKQKLTYRKANNVKVFFAAWEQYTNANYVRRKIAEITAGLEPEVAREYLADTEAGYPLNELGFVIDRAQDIFGIEVYFQAGSAAWIGWEGMAGMDADDFGDDYEEIGAFIEKNRLEEVEFMRTWPARYAALKAEYLATRLA